MSLENAIPYHDEFVPNPTLAPVDSPVTTAKDVAALPEVVGNIRALPSDDLLSRLPREHGAGASLLPLVIASLEIGSVSVDHLSKMSVNLGTDCESFFLMGFATLLARLAGQEVVKVRQTLLAPEVVTFRFDPDVSFRSLLSTIPSTGYSSDGHCAVDFLCGVGGLSHVDFPRERLRMAVHFSDTERRAGCRVWLASSTGLWGRPILQLWLRYFETLLVAAASTPDVPWTSLPLLDPNEAEEFYLAFNATSEPYPDDMCVHQLVARHAERTPGAIAIVTEEHCLTYKELDERSDAIAARLQALGAGPGRPVAISVERNAQLPVALLGILKSGSCYVPLDQQDSPQRLKAVLEECQPAAMIVDKSFPLASVIHNAPLLYLDGVPDAPVGLAFSPSGVTAAQEAYIIYTSGTTGKPKGVVITHRALVNLLESMMRAPGFTPDDRILAVSPISFDIATMEMFLPLVAGGTLVVGDRLIRADPPRLATLLETFDITFLQATPSTWRLLALSGWEGKPGLKMISGGEALPRDLANLLLSRGAELWNCYGPTETTIWSSVLRIEADADVVPIGPPIANTTFYILDDLGRLLPPGVPGELYIGGTGVSRGYLAHPQNAVQRFFADPYAQAAGSQMFRSGDLVRLINGNEFEFFGRLDHQVKLLGHRIELGEIESALRTFPQIENAVAALREDEPGEPYLIVYFTADDHQLDLRLLRDHVSCSLPAYMVPRRFVLMEAMPLTVSGKIDRTALLVSASSGLTAYREPEGIEARTELEKKLLRIFREVLNTAQLGVTDSFFDFGGYSLLTVKLFHRIHRTLKLSLPISLLFEASTVKALAAFIETKRPLSLIVPIRPRGKTAPLFVIHSYLLYAILPRICEPDRPVYGVREPADVSAELTVEDRAATYVGEILTLYPDGPLLLAGWCAAGSLTVEIARQLLQLGREVGSVALFDAERPGFHATLSGSRTSRLLARVRFHLGRVRGVSLGQKLDYVRNGLRHTLDSLVERLFMRHRRVLLGLQRLLGFSLPDAVFNNTWSRVADLQNYTLSRYPGRVVLFRAADVPQLPSGDETLGWGEIVDDGVEVVFVPGDHESMFDINNADFFRSRFREALSG